MAFAVVEFDNCKIADFWKMTMMDFHLYSLRVIEQRRRRTEDHELTIEMTRSFMTLFANVNRGKGAKAFTPDDFFKLSYDTTMKEAPKIDSSNFMEDMRKRFTPKNKRNG